MNSVGELSYNSLRSNRRHVALAPAMAVGRRHCKMVPELVMAPFPERGEVTKVASICTMCPGGCPGQARLVNGNRAILIEGNPTNPLTGGGICALGASGLQFLYAPYRIPQPMKQEKGRGNISGFQPVSWDEALGELGKKLGQMKTDGKSQELAAIISNRQSSMDVLWRQFFTAYGSPGLFRMPSATDGLKFAAELTTGIAQPFARGRERRIRIEFWSKSV